MEWNTFLFFSHHLCILSNPFMSSFSIFFPLLFISFPLLVSPYTFSQKINPNFTASHLQFIDNKGAFLFSSNETFKASIFNPGGQQTRFYLCIIHVPSSTIVWSANRDAPISNSGRMELTVKGITITDDDGNLRWSTPPLSSPVHALLLSEMGNLIMLDHLNVSIWESFQNPTDTVVTGQRLISNGKVFLSSSVSDSDFSTGDYKFSITGSDAILQWHGKTYWKLSMDTKAYTNSNYVVEYMEMNRTGLFLFGQGGKAVVIQVILLQSEFKIAKLDASGQFTIRSFNSTGWKQDLVGPIDGCQIPFICGKMGLCTDDSLTSTPVCSCPQNFHLVSQNKSGCVPSNSSYSLPFACEASNQNGDNHNNNQLINSSAVSYLKLDYGVKYFSNIFSQPEMYHVNLSFCQDLCSDGCSCLGIFYKSSSGACYVLEDELGSLMFDNSEVDLLGYIKAIVGSDATDPGVQDGHSHTNQSKSFPLAGLVLLPFAGILISLFLGLLLWRRQKSNKRDTKMGKLNSLSSEDLDAFFIPGLPRRFDYEELEVATSNFKTQIGSGGFGSVYRGVLSDKTVVAVKKITNIGIQGKKDFCTEIAVIGNIRHLNLVKLKGFCAQGRQRLLVYEYMNRGSLDRTLFGNGLVLEWQERFDIALGTARGLAYLHSGCDQKIIHCDIKPENILLHDHFQPKISDFGLSKLLSPEESSLFTTMRGTRGYLAPEWLTNSAISEKTDVYSFGMVLLELVSGRKNCSLRLQSPSTGESSGGGGCLSVSSMSDIVYFPLLALEMHEQGRYLELADPRLEGRVTSEEVKKLVCIALCCVHEEPCLRPNMVGVVGMLEGRTAVAQPRIKSLNFLRFIGRRFAENSMVEEENQQDHTTVLHQRENNSSTPSFSPSYFSYISSQSVSGPR